MIILCRNCGRRTPTECLPPEKDEQLWLQKSQRNKLVCPDCGSKDIEVKVKQLKIGRNQPCYCGSGKKFKKCCLK